MKRSVQGRRKNYEDFISSKEWKEQSKFIINRDDRCIICGFTKKQLNALGISLNAHHIDDEFYSLPLAKMKSFSGCRIITLCVKCHDFITNIKRENYFKLNKTTPEDYVSILPSRKEVTRKNETIKSENYRRNTPLMSQWTNS